MRQSILTRAKEIANGLYPHQIEGIAFLLSRRRALLADYMGLGKTRQSVLAMVEAERTGLYLVICPASVKRNWEREILYVLLKVDTAIVGPTDATEEADKNPERRRVVGKLATARRKLAFAKCRHTIKFVKNAIEQGEKVILFSTFLNTIERFYKHFGTQAVVVSGEVPTGERQTRVDQFQNDANVRLFIANMHVAGVGLNLTAGRQVVFNDLDWVPANHWQAEDRAYRIGQTGTVNVTYMIARDTFGEFVKTVLETKASLMSAFVEGTLLMPDENGPLQGDVLSELKRLMNVLSIHATEIEQTQLLDVLRKVSDAYLEDNVSHLREATREQLRPYSEEAIHTLAKVIAGPQRTVYHVQGSSQKEQFYTLEVVGADVTCGCPGFIYRGSCRHVRPLKSALVADKPLPEGYQKIC